MPDDPDALSFRVTTASLSGAIQILLERGGLAEYPDRQAFDGLPHDVQQLLLAPPVR
jgi:hypothetical protein